MNFWDVPETFDDEYSLAHDVCEYCGVSDYLHRSDCPLTLDGLTIEEEDDTMLDEELTLFDFEDDDRECE